MKHQGQDHATDTKTTMKKILSGLCSFEEYKPFDKNGHPKNDVGTIAIFRQTSTRSGIEVDDRHYTRSAWCFFTDYGLTDEQVKTAFKAELGINVLGEDEFNAVFAKFKEKTRKNFTTISFKEACEARMETPRPIASAKVPSTIIELPPHVWKDRYELNEKAFAKHIAGLGIDMDTDIQYRFTSDEHGETDGTPGYLLCLHNGHRKAIKGNCPEWSTFCDRFGLKAVNTRWLSATHLMDPENPNSIFSYSTNGGCLTERFAINLASGHIVPMDDQMDISHHKGGWYYSHKYMGPGQSFAGNFEVVTAQDEDRFAMSNDYSVKEDAPWAARSIVKIARLLHAWGAPDNAALSVEVTDHKDRKTLHGNIAQLAAIDPIWQKVAPLLRNGCSDPSGDTLTNDPLVAELRRICARMADAPLGRQTGDEKMFLKLLEDLAGSLGIQSDKLADALQKAKQTLNRGDIEICKEIVHSHLRKTPMFGIVYGPYADPENIFFPQGESLSAPGQGPR